MFMPSGTRYRAGGRAARLLDSGEAADRRVEAVVRLVVVALAHLAQQHRPGAGLDLEIVVEVLPDVDALARREAHLRARGDGVAVPVGLHEHGGVVVDLLVRQTVVDPDQHVAAAPVDDVLGLVPVEVVGAVLPLLEIQQLFRVDLGILFRQGAAAVADRDERHADLVEVAEAVVGDVPAEQALAHLVVLVAKRPPLVGRESAEGRQGEAVGPAHGLQLAQRAVDLGTFHRRLPFVDGYIIKITAALVNLTAG